MHRKEYRLYEKTLTMASESPVQDSDKKKYFRMLARAVPSGWIVRGNDAIEEDCFSQFSAEELEGLDIIGMGIKLHHKGDAVIGRVIDKLISPEDALLVQLEIPMDDDLSTPGGSAVNQVKRNVIHMVEQGFLKDISLAHRNNYTPDDNWEHLIVEKQPLEISVTPDGYREGSRILSYEWADKPYLPESEYVRFSPSNSTCKSVIDFVPDKVPEVILASLEAHRNKKKEKETQPVPQKESTMADKKTTPDDFNALLKRYNEMQAELQRIKPVYEQTVAQEEAKQKAAKAEFQKDSSALFDSTIEILKRLSGEQGKSEEDKALYEEKIADLVSRKERTEPMIDELVNTSANDPKFNESFQRMQDMVANMSTAVMACSRFAASTLDRVESQKQELLKLRNNAGGATNVASTDATSSAKRPSFMSFNDFMSAKKAKYEGDGLDKDSLKA